MMKWSRMWKSVGLERCLMIKRSCAGKFGEESGVISRKNLDEWKRKAPGPK